MKPVLGMLITNAILQHGRDVNKVLSEVGEQVSGEVRDFLVWSFSDWEGRCFEQDNFSNRWKQWQDYVSLRLTKFDALLKSRGICPKKRAELLKKFQTRDMNI
jgi:hypothetical protein